MAFPQPPFQSMLNDMRGRLTMVWAQWLARAQIILNAITASGSNGQELTKNLYTGQPYFNTEQNQLFMWNGSQWMSVGVLSGPTENKPTSPYVGEIYFDTTLGQQVSWNGSAWVSAFDTAFYGSFYDTNATQTLASTTVEEAIKINSTAESRGISIENDGSGNPTKIQFTYAGTYNIQYSVQFTNSNTSIQNVNIWLRKNDSGATGNVDYSNSQYAIINSHGGTHGQMIAAVNYVVSVVAGDYLQLMWQATSTGVYIETIPAGTTPAIPVSPGVILTVCEV